MSRISFCLVVFMTACLSARGQITISEFLKSASDDQEVRSFNEQLNYLQKKPYRLSPLQRLEFRTQNRELDREQQEYALRFNPSNPWEVRNNNLYFKEYQSVLALEKEMEFKDALTNRYQLVIDYLYFTELYEITNENQNLINDQLSVLEKQLGSSFFDADDYVKLRLDLLEKSVELEEADFEIHNLQNQVHVLYPGSHGKQVVWDNNRIIKISNIQRIVDSLSELSVKSTLINYQQQKINLASREYQLEKSNISPGFFQTEYDRRRFHQERTPFNISMGITIPITNPNKGDMAKRQLEMIEAKYDLEEAKQESKLDLIVLQEKLRQLIARHDNLLNKITELEKGDLATNLQKIRGNNPLIVIEFRANTTKLKTLLVKLKRKVLIAYVDYLSFTDQLQQEPLTNFLSRSLEKM